ncbi:MAG: hypothetical protein ABI862_10065 [Ilumatobacteraceae bacterium]
MNDFNPAQRDPAQRGPADQDLADQLRRQAQSLDIGDTPIASVVGRGRQRRERRRVAVGIVAVAALSGTAIGTIQLLSKPTSHRIIASTDSEPAGEVVPNVTIAGTAPADDLTPVNRVDSNLVWNAVEPGSAEALGGTNFGYDLSSNQRQAPYLAWSTAPGHSTDPNQSYAPKLWRSDDGIHWQLAGDGTFTKPDVQMYGLGSRSGRLFAYGTAAATAPIPKGGGGDVVVDVSDDQGASWKHITLPVDLRGMSKMDGVQSVGFSGSLAVGKDAVVAVASPYPNFSRSIHQRFASGFAVSRDGITPINNPSCSANGTVPTSTIPGIAAPGVTSPADTSPADSTVLDPTTTIVAFDGSAPDATVTADNTGCTVDTTPQAGSLVPWSEVGVDPRAVDAMFTPRVFVSTDGDNFVEGVFPAPPGDNLQPGSIPQLIATDNGFVGIAQFFDQAGQQSVTKLYTSADGLTWSETETGLGQINTLQALPDGTLVAFGQDSSPYQNSGGWVATSSDGVEWTKRSMSGLLDASDGHTAMVNVWQIASGPSGLTVVANIDVDMAAEAGGISIDKDGVRLTLTESRVGTLVATDIASGEELGRLDGRTQPASDAILGYDSTGGGGLHVLDDDGTVRVEFSNEDMQGIYNEQNTYTPKPVVLNSTDGINWSRDDVESLAGFKSFGGGRIQVTDSNVLVSVTEPSTINADGTPTNPGAIPKTVVLVGTPKS